MPLLIDLVHPTSVVDVGGGTGAWLSVFKQLGVKNVLCIDGYVNDDILLIDKDEFLPLDLSKPFSGIGEYDLALSLEVAEHLPPNSAVGFVESLSNLAPVIFFCCCAWPRRGEPPK